MSRPAVLVTGGAGFIGAHACKALDRAGFLPVVLDNLSTGHADVVRWGPLVRADVRNAAAVAEAIREHGCIAAMHFASLAYVGDSVARPVSYYDNNVGGMIGLLAGAAQVGLRAVVFSSSCAVYGAPGRAPIAEDAQPRPVNPYGRTKLICEQMLRDHAAAGGPDYLALRYFNAAGADPDGTLGERHAPETHLLPLALMAAAGSIPALRVLGSDYDTPDGTCIRDYIHVADLAQAHVLALRHLLSDGPSMTLNLGTGRGHSVREVVAAVTRVTGCRPRIEEASRRPGDPPVLLADPTRAQQVLGFRPSHSTLDRMIADAAPWFLTETLDATG